MQQNNSAEQQHLHEASKYIHDWLTDNLDNAQVIETAKEWARRHGTAEHNGHVLSGLLLVENRDNELTLMAVRWLTEYSMHPLAPQIVAGLTRKG